MEEVVFRDNNLKQREFIEAVFSGKYSLLTFGGAIRGGKTFVGIAILIMLCLAYPGSRWAIIRKDLKRLKDNTLPSILKFLGNSEWKYNASAQTFTAPNGSVIILKGENYDRDKELDGFKGLEINGALMEEANECRYKTALKVQERAGAYVIPGIDKNKQPNPIVMFTCNPTQGWMKDMFYTPWKSASLPSHMFYLPSYVTDNPNLPEIYVESLKRLPQYEYMVYVLGDWEVSLKQANAFWREFDAGKHIKAVDYDGSKVIHVSIDSNSMPYCSATLWQVYTDSKRVVQIGEVTARPRGSGEDGTDQNHAGGLGKLVNDFLKDLEYDDVVIIYGDATTQAQNTIDEKKRSFFDIFTEVVRSEYEVEHRIGRSNPPIALTASFVNALYSGWADWKIEISEDCKASISDYLNVTTDADGTMRKARARDDAGNSYEEYGHLSDTKRYFLYKCLGQEFADWRNRFKPKEENTYATVATRSVFTEQERNTRQDMF